VSLSLHPPSFTMSELLHKAMPRAVPTLYRLCVMANGLLFHCTGRTAKFLNGKTESFQTEHGMRAALRRAGFVDISFKRVSGHAGEMFLAEARKPGTAVPSV
jgi:predicted methyltransferase